MDTTPAAATPYPPYPPRMAVKAKTHINAGPGPEDCEHCWHYKGHGQYCWLGKVAIRHGACRLYER